MNTYQKLRCSMLGFGTSAITLIAVMTWMWMGGVLSVQAGLIPDRDTLNAILGDNQILEDFESFAIADEDATNLDVSVLDHDTITNGQGPGLVEPGAVYRDPSAVQLQWNGHNYYNLETKTLLSNGATGDIEILYTINVLAMGLDLRAYVDYEYNGVVDVYDASNVLISSTGFALSEGGPENIFFGWQHEAGIGRVVLRSDDFSWSPLIDNHGYGVPEPGMVCLLGLGGLSLLRRRRK